MNNKCIAITTTIIAAAMLAGIVATTPITTVYADESETEKNEKCKVGDPNMSGQSSLAISVNCEIDAGF